MPPDLTPPATRNRPSPEHCLERLRPLQEALAQRRSVRHFTEDPIPQEVIQALIETAGSAPSGANKQPWTFIAVRSAEMKAQIRHHAEHIEQANYDQRFNDAMKRDLKPLGTTWQKPQLTEAAWVIAVFAQRHGVLADGRQDPHYYVKESVGIAVGMLLSAAAAADLATLVYTPSPMAFLNDLLGRPDHEMPFALVLIGHPHPDFQPPDLPRKPLEDLLIIVD